MQYRPFGDVDFSVSALGFGVMRLPVNGGGIGDINKDKAIPLLRHAIDLGVNYFDTAYPYHDGQSEVVLGEALRDGYRKKVKIADKLPTWMVNEPADVEKLLDEQLQRLQVDHIDFYLCHNLNGLTWPHFEQNDVIETLRKAKAQGKIGHIGFSVHDSFEPFKKYVDYTNAWEFVQMQYNYVNEQVQAGTQGLEYAASKGLPVVVMEPLLGGCLADPPQAVTDILQAACPDRTPVDWSLRWLWNRPEVGCVISGMSTIEQVTQNAECASTSGVGTLSEEELEALHKAATAYHSLGTIPCTKCGYCMPCPNGVDIPRNFEMMNDLKRFGGNQITLNRVLYQNFIAKEIRAEHCTQCGACAPKCPQSIKIDELMPQVHDELIKPPASREE